MSVSAFAPAKVNLYLHVVGKRADGYHLLDSLVAFADIGDRVTATPAAGFSLRVTGPEAAGVEELGDDNLVLRAARRFVTELQRRGRRGAAAFHLDKRLPAASGIGGGSSDTAAALRVLDAMWRHPLDPSALAALALELGADTPACLAAVPVWVGGIGEQLEPAAGLPAAGIVLANPRRPLSTATVFAARRGAFSPSGRFAPMPQDVAALVARLAERRNDLTEAALTLVPEIGRVLECLAQLPGALLVRMSGSGATCFALFADRRIALLAGKILALAQPDWWSAAGALMTTPPPVEDHTDRTSG